MSVPSTSGPRVVMVVRLFDPWIGGMERQALRLARRLADRGCSVRIVTGWWFRGTPRREVIDGIAVERLWTAWEGFGVRGLRTLGGYLFMASLAAHLWRNRHGYDVIHVHGLNYHTAVASIVGRAAGRPTLVKLANSGSASDIAKMRKGALLPLSRLLLPAALRTERFVAVSGAVGRDLAAAGVAASRIVEIPNGIEVPPPPARDRALRRAPSLLFVGRLHEQKGVDALLRAVRRLLDERPEEQVRLRVVGDGPEALRLRVLSRELELGGAVTFEGAHDDVTSFLSDAGVLVLPSRAEGLSNVLLEAMAAGLPIVASAIGPNAEVLRDGVDGVLVPPDDPERLAGALARVLDDPGLRRRIGRSAYERVRARFEIGGVAERYVELYEELVGARRTGPHPDAGARRNGDRAREAHGLRVTYVIGTYPGLTTTFIDREIDALRRRGVSLSVLSIRPPDRRIDGTSDVPTVLPVSILALADSHLRFLLRRPVAYVGSLAFLLTRPHRDLRTRMRTLLHFGVAVRAAALIARSGPCDRIHAHFVDRATVVAFVAARLLDVPYSATAHARDIYVDPVLLAEKAEGASFVATCTDYNRRHLEATLGPAAVGKIRCIRHGVDAARYASNGHGARPTPPRILAVGQLREKKGFDDLVRACRLLADRGIAFSCEIVGDGPLDADLRSSVRSLGLGDVVRLTGALPHDAVIERYARASLFVLPSVTAADGDRDGIPNVVLEAMASGLPVVATDTSGIPEAVQHGETGLLVPMRDPGALADALAVLLCDPDLRTRLGSRGRRAVIERFDVSANADDLLAEFLA